MIKFFIIELTINFIELVLNRQEHHPPAGNWVVIVFSDDFSGFEEVFLVWFEKFQICLHIVILDLNFSILRSLNGIEEGNSFLLSVLQLQVVNELEFISVIIVLLLGHCGQEVIVSVTEVDVKDA